MNSMPEPAVVSDELRSTISRIIEAGYQLSADGFDYLKTLKDDDLRELTGRAIRAAESSTNDILILDQPFLQQIVGISRKETRELRIFSRRAIKRPLASEHEGQMQVLDEKPQESSGDLESFVDYFRSRFRKMEHIFKQRIDMRDAVSIGDAIRMPLKSKMKVIGIVTTKRTSGSRIFLEIEDLENSITVMASDDQTVRKGLIILQDQAICVDAIKYKQDLLIARNFIWPDTPHKNNNRSEIPLCAAFLADFHIGSKLFHKETYNIFTRWMNLKVGQPKLRRLAERVKYIIIAGDLVDGIGVYPNQLDELEITDIREQYEAAAILLSELPDYVEIIIIPGNHDAVRKSLPQPPIPVKYAERLHDDERIHFLSNPSHILLNGVDVYICHGKSLDDVLSNTPWIDFNNPVSGMESLLRCRHLAPTYGISTPIAPDKEDKLVIESTPDVFQMGHIHVYGYRRYKETTLIASSSWQEQTSFQKRVNIKPTVGIAPIFDLKTHQVTPVDFKRLS